MAELASVSVDKRFENRGIGGKLMQYAEARAKALGVETLFCLSTQAFNFFQQKGGFVEGKPDDLAPRPARALRPERPPFARPSQEALVTAGRRLSPIRRVAGTAAGKMATKRGRPLQSPPAGV